MNENYRYVKIVEWSDEDDCFVGSCPGLFFGGCHGNDEKQVFAELCEIVKDTIELYMQQGKFLSPPTSGKDYATKMLSVAS
jgi:predicted RNase H-like HicB family nuclease